MPIDIGPKTEERIEQLSEPLFIHKLALMKNGVDAIAKKNGSSLSELYKIMAAADDTKLPTEQRRLKLMAAVKDKVGGDELAASVCSLLYGVRFMAMNAGFARVNSAVTEAHLAPQNNIVIPLQFRTMRSEDVIHKELVDFVFNVNQGEVGRKQVDEAVRRFDNRVKDFVKDELGIGKG